MRMIHFWEGVDIALKAVAALAVGLLVILALTRCGASTESSYTPVVLAAHGCGGVSVQVGGVVVGAEFCEATVTTTGGLKPCTVVESVSANGVPLGRGAIEALSDPACGEVYGWFPAGLVVGAHDGDRGDVGADGAAAPDGGAGGAVTEPDE